MTEASHAPGHPAQSGSGHAPHPHSTTREHGRPVVTSSERVGANGKIGVFITTAVGTMWTAYAFAVVALISLPAAIRTRHAHPA